MQSASLCPLLTKSASSRIWARVTVSTPNETNLVQDLNSSHRFYSQRNQPRPAFELESPCPLSTKSASSRIWARVTVFTPNEISLVQVLNSSHCPLPTKSASSSIWARVTVSTTNEISFVQDLSLSHRFHSQRNQPRPGLELVSPFPLPTKSASSRIWTRATVSTPNEISLVQDLNSSHRVHFKRWCVCRHVIM